MSILESPAAIEATDTLTALGDDPELSKGAIERYARAVEDAAVLRAEWNALGRPGLSFGSTGQLVRHPLSIELRDAEEHASKLASKLGLDPQSRKGKRRPGRPPGVTLEELGSSAKTEPLRSVR